MSEPTNRAPYYVTVETPAGETVRAVIHVREDGECAVTIGGTIPRAAYATTADNLSEALAFTFSDMRGFLTAGE